MTKTHIIAKTLQLKWKTEIWKHEKTKKTHTNWCSSSVFWSCFPAQILKSRYIYLRSTITEGKQRIWSKWSEFMLKTRANISRWAQENTLQSKEKQADFQSRMADIWSHLKHKLTSDSFLLFHFIVHVNITFRSVLLWYIPSYGKCSQNILARFFQSYKCSLNIC